MATDPNAASAGVTSAAVSPEEAQARVDQVAQDEPSSTAHFTPSAIGGGNVEEPDAVYLEHAPVSPGSILMCPYCKVGIMHVVTYDEDATHEAGNLVFDPSFKSGGAASLQCRHCGKGHSVALNPSKAPADPLAGRI